MGGEKDIKKLLKGMTPILNEGVYVFSTVKDISQIDRELPICEFKEKESTTIVIEKLEADKLGLSYEYIASWITLTIHSSLDAVGLTAIFSTALAESQISCNVIAGFYHDHIFVDTKDAEKAMDVLMALSKNA